MDRLNKYKKKKWFSEKTNVDLETGEVLTDSRIEREDWIKVNSSSETIDCGSYYLKKHINGYKKSRQLRIGF